jgi:hypothetical protein
VDKNGTLIKSDLDLLQKGLIFYPVDGDAAMAYRDMSTNFADSVVAALDVEAATGIDIPDQATHILVEAFIDFNLHNPDITDPGHYVYNAFLDLYLSDIMPPDNKPHEKYRVARIDGETKRRNVSGYIDFSGSNEQQSSTSAVVKLSPTNTIAYKLKFKMYCSQIDDPAPTIEEICQDHSFSLRLKGYYIPLSTLLEQQ